MINRRKLVIALGAGAIAAPFGSLAQQTAKVFRIGLLTYSDDRGTPRIAAFLDELTKFGWVEGKNIFVEYRSAEGKIERFPSLISELVRLKVDLIFTVSTPTAQAAKSAIRDIPIVFSMVSDPIASGLVVSLGRPGGNITGWSNMLPETSAKLLQLLMEVNPKTSHVGVLWDPSNPAKELEMRLIQAAAKQVGLKLRSLPVRGLSDIEAAFSTMRKDRSNGVVVLQDNVTGSHREAITQLAAGIRLPAIYQVSEFVDAGGLMSYGASMLQQFRRGAYYVDKILKGTKPGDLPVEQPTKFELVINGKTAKALGIKIPQSLLIMADRVIE